ncbi:MAG TPA: VCBS repeat-containing protein, partial [Planctomycetota bacterium]|nr:VCBS repeat-containing protein [Planctomycetota bacterium]
MIRTVAFGLVLAQGPLFPGVGVKMGPSVRGVVAADLDGNGSPDLAAAVSTGVAVAIATTPGSFADAAQISLAGAARGIATGRIDADAIPDLVASVGSQVAILRGQGGGAFAAPVMVASPFAAGPLAAGDLNGDQRADVIALSTTSGQAAVFLAAGGSLALSSTLPLPTIPTAVALGDFDHSGSLDLAIASATFAPGGSIAAFLNDGTGHFVATPVPGDSTFARDVEIADVDSDGSLDVLSFHSSGFSPRIDVRRGDGAGHFVLGASTPVAVGLGAKIGVGSFGGDSAPDVVVSDFGTRVLVNT